MSHPLAETAQTETGTPMNTVSCPRASESSIPIPFLESASSTQMSMHDLAASDSTRKLLHELERVTTELHALRGENQALQQKVSELNAYMRLAYRDPLTGIHNRRYFEKRIHEEINRVQHRPEQMFSIMLIDVNEFKEINDTYGHATGDEALKWVASFLVGNIRTHDICCRWAGDEFVILLPNADAKACRNLLDRLRRRLQSARQWLELPIGLSIGAATYQVNGLSLEELYRAADESMYKDKHKQKKLRLNEGPKTKPMPHRRIELVQSRSVSSSESEGVTMGTLM